jgi:amino acid permease
MASTGIDHAPSQYHYDEKIIGVDAEKDGGYDSSPRRPSEVGSVAPAFDTTQRRLKPRHIQLIGIGGTIGTALYVQIGKGLMNGGPGQLKQSTMYAPLILRSIVVFGLLLVVSFMERGLRNVLRSRLASWQC